MMMSSTKTPRVAPTAASALTLALVLGPEVGAGELDDWTGEVDVEVVVEVMATLGVDVLSDGVGITVVSDVGPATE